jgi:hypothetical protein
VLEFKGDAGIVPGTSYGIGRRCALFYARDRSRVFFSIIIKGQLEKAVLAAGPAVKLNWNRAAFIPGASVQPMEALWCGIKPSIPLVAFTRFSCS